MLLLHSGVLLAHCLLSFLVIELLLGHHWFRLTSTENVALVRVRFLLLLWGSIAKNTALPLSLLLLLSIVRLLCLHLDCLLSALTNAAHAQVVLRLLLLRSLVLLWGSIAKNVALPLSLLLLLSIVRLLLLIYCRLSALTNAAHAHVVLRLLLVLLLLRGRLLRLIAISTTNREAGAATGRSKNTRR